MAITYSILGMVAAVGEAIATAVGAAATAVGSVISAPVVIGAAVVAGIALAGYALYESGFFGWLGDVLEDGWNWLKNGFGKVVQKAKSIVQDDIIPGIKNIINSMSKEESLEGKDDEKERLPNQGTVEGNIEGAPPVDAGKQGKHVPGHNNNNPNKSQWPEGETGVDETQQGWLEGTELPDGTKVWDSGEPIGPNGETGVRVHMDGKGNIHGYPVNPSQYLK